MATKEKISELYNGYLDNDLSKEDLEEFLQLLHTPDGEKEIELLMNSTWQQMFETERYTVVPMYKRTWYRVAAAVIFIVLSVGAYFLFNTKKQQQHFVVTKVKQDVAPGRQGAILTIGSGKQIVLDSAADGKISDEAVKKGNEVSYVRSETPDVRSEAQDVKVENNTMTTPKGRQFELVLADGSKVWLNAASSITYPTAFTGNERKVQITGEAYFEVAHNAAMPFVVEKNSASSADRDVSIQVLGTHFNVNTYDDEAVMKITLLEGSVKVTLRQAQGDRGIIIKPGQQAQLTNDPSTSSGQAIKVVNADVDQAVAWKNGLFSLNKTDMQTFMRMISRWYDVDVEYQGAIPTGTISGKAQRSLSFSQMQEVLQLTDVHFKVEGRKLIVTK